MFSLMKIGFNIINKFFPLYPILKFVTTMTITMWSIIFNPFNWLLGNGSAEATNEERCKKENLNQHHSDRNKGCVAEIEENTISHPPITTSDEPHYLIQDSFSTSKSRFVPSGEHFKGTNALVAELKLLHQQMKLKSLEKSETENTSNIDEDDLTIIMPIAKPRKSLLTKRSYSSVVQTNSITPPVPFPRGKAVAKA
ncbi:unnamed protein product [Orchesella dallaii]|uniref:Uncharacterized protein n=1 Tax=Orchesella dallaii TaxID=48710 RepID=A0ABP1RJ44_9HEXA